MKIQEQIIRTVGPVGNGAHVFMPKEWSGEKVLVFRLESKNIEERILERLAPHFADIISVFIYGSHARGEATELSDVDVLVVAKSGFKIEKKDDLEIIVVPEEKLAKAFEINPILMHSVSREAKPLVNSSYLENLRAFEFTKKQVRSFVLDTKKSVESTKEILDLNEKEEGIASSSVIYSLFLRLRGVYIIKSLLIDKKYTNALFSKWIQKNCGVNYRRIYQDYVFVRDGLGKKAGVSTGDANKLVKLLENELRVLK
jgi:predicted nucleotidyltransferase